ncbi:hypothetical protein MARINOS108_10456 [Marinoscillum sp. 108]|nr:hypothetical protein MARINOS108_10456 [Marinoscillum sp. 108]
MENPFQELYERLDRIERLLVSVRDHKASEPEGEEDRLLNVREAARFLGDAVATLYGRTSKNDIPFYKRGKIMFLPLISSRIHSLFRNSSEQFVNMIVVKLAMLIRFFLVRPNNN